MLSELFHRFSSEQSGNQKVIYHRYVICHFRHRYVWPQRMLLSKLSCNRKISCLNCIVCIYRKTLGLMNASVCGGLNWLVTGVNSNVNLNYLRHEIMILFSCACSLKQQRNNRLANHLVTPVFSSWVKCDILPGTVLFNKRVKPIQTFSIIQRVCGPAGPLCWKWKVSVKIVPFSSFQSYIHVFFLTLPHVCTLPGNGPHRGAVERIWHSPWSNVLPGNKL